MVKIDKAIPRLQTKNIILDLYSHPRGDLFYRMLFDGNYSKEHHVRNIFEGEINISEKQAKSDE